MHRPRSVQRVRVRSAVHSQFWTLFAASTVVISCAASTPGAASQPSTEIEDRGPPGEVEIRSLPHRAVVVRLGGESLGETPVTITIAAGASKRVSLAALGFEPCTMEVMPTPGVAKSQRIALVPSAAHPAWVTAGSRLIPSDPPVLVGVGGVVGIKNPRLAEVAASNQARGELQTLWNALSDNLMRRYAASQPPAPSEPDVSEESMVISEAKTYSPSPLSGAKIVDVWRHPDANVVYAKASIDLATFIELIERDPGVKADLRALLPAAIEDTTATAYRVCR